MTWIINVAVVYIALYIVILLHELGHVPERINWKVGTWKTLFLPRAAAMRANYRLGGLMVNIVLLMGIYAMKPQNRLLLYIGLVAWIHFIIYSIAGSITPEKSGKVNIRLTVFDDVPNEMWWVFIPAAIIAYFTFSHYYIPILTGIFG